MYVRGRKYVHIADLFYSKQFQFKRFLTWTAIGVKFDCKMENLSCPLQVFPHWTQLHAEPDLVELDLDNICLQYLVKFPQTNQEFDESSKI